jgi:hypothetical protein
MDLGILTSVTSVAIGMTVSSETEVVLVAVLEAMVAMVVM